MSDQRYNLRGVSASKEDVHNAIKNIDKGIFPNAFCKIIPDILGGDPEYCNIMHADGAGTKSSLAYMYWKETGDLSVWKGIAQDALIMNIDDLLCVGAVDNILVSSTIGRNKLLIPGEVISAIINGTDELLAELREKLGDRPVLRALHFFGEEKRVDEEIAALERGDFDAFKKWVKASGASSFQYLQNVFTVRDLNGQGLSVGLAVSDAVLGERGVSRVHGGGFAGTIQAFVPLELLDSHKRYIVVFTEG